MEEVKPAVKWEAFGDQSFCVSEDRPAPWVLQMAEASPIASVVSDPRQQDNPIVVVNQPFIDLTGYPPDEILGRNCRFLAGDGTEPWLTEKIREGVRNCSPVIVEILNYKKNGDPFRNAVLVAPIFDDENQLLHFLGSQVEIADGDPALAASRRERAAAMVKTLSPRQFEVTRMVAAGLLNKQIAAALGLSEKTIKMHRKLVMEKLELRTSADLIRVAVEAGI